MFISKMVFPAREAAQILVGKHGYFVLHDHRILYQGKLESRDVLLRIPVLRLSSPSELAFSQGPPLISPFIERTPSRCPLYHSPHPQPQTVKSSR